MHGHGRGSQAQLRLDGRIVDDRRQQPLQPGIAYRGDVLVQLGQ